MFSTCLWDGSELIGMTAFISGSRFWFVVEDIWESSSVILDMVKLKAFHPINSSPLTDCFHPLFHCLCFHANCSSDLTNCMPLLLLSPFCTKPFSHPYFITFIWLTDNIWEMGIVYYRNFCCPWPVPSYIKN